MGDEGSDYYRSKKDVEKTYLRKKQIELGKRVFVVTTGAMTVVGFVVSLWFFIDMAIRQSLAGEINSVLEGQIYGYLIVTFILLGWSVIAIVWFRKIRKESVIIEV